MAFTADFLSTFEGETAGANPADWTNDPTYSTGGNRWVISSTGLSGSRSLSLQCLTGTASLTSLLYRNLGGTTGSDKGQVTFKIRATNTLSSGSVIRVMMNGGMSPTAAYAGNITVKGMGVYASHRPDPALGGSLPTEDTDVLLFTMVANTTYTMTITTLQDSGKYYVQQGSTTYDNGGMGFNLTVPVPISSVVLYAYGQTTTDNQRFLIDDIQSYFDAGSISMTAYADDSATPGDGWYLGRPNIMAVESEMAEGEPGNTYYLSVGTASDHDALIAPFTKVINASPQQILTDAQMDSIKNKVAFLYYGTANDPKQMDSIPIGWTDTVPVITQSLSILDQSRSVATTNLPSEGYIRVDGVRGYSAALPSDQYHYKVNDVEVYVNGKLWYTASRTNTANPPSFDDEFTYPLITCETYANGESGETDADHRFWRITIAYSQGSYSFPLNVHSIYVVIRSEAGSTCRSTTSQLTSDSTIPSIDRLAVGDGEYGSSAVFLKAYKQGAYETGTGDVQAVIGNVTSTIPISTLEYSFERRLPLLGAKLVGTTDTFDNKPALESSGVSMTADAGPTPDAGPNNAHFSSSGYIAYENNAFSIGCGTVDVWVKPDAWASNSTKHHVFSFGKSTGLYSRIGMYFEYTGSTWKLVGEVIDANGNSHKASLDTGKNAASIASTYMHCRLVYELNKPNSSSVGVRLNGSALTQVTGSIPFYVGPSLYTQATSVITVEEESNYYTPIYIGCRNDKSEYFVGRIVGVRVSDTLRSDSPWSWDNLGGWVDASSYIDTTTGMFSLNVSGLADNELQLMRLRPVDMSGRCHNASYFNTGQGRPILVSGLYTGVVVGSETVYRFRLIDATGQFDDYRFPYNPQSFDFEIDNERVSDSVSVTGHRSVQVRPGSPVVVRFEWQNIEEGFANELARRADSGNSFFLTDHNNQVYFGKLTLDSRSEVVATKPSRYKVSMTFMGQGGLNDYRMV